MIISKAHSYIFVHIPKTGGTSLALALEAKVGKDDILLGDTPKAAQRRKRVKGAQAAGRLWKHSTLRDLPGLVSEAEVDAARIFTIVRNPWDRIVSYYHWLQAQSFDHPAVGLAKDLEFSKFLNQPQTRKSFEANPYGSYVTRRDGREDCDLFLRLEHIDEDLPRLEALLGLKLGKMPHENRSERGDYRDAYSKTDRDLVGEIAARDIARFGYQF